MKAIQHMSEVLSGTLMRHAPMLGLRQMNGMRVIRRLIVTTTRTKPSRALLSTTHEANEQTYSLLAQACLRACMLRQKDIFYKLPYFAKIAQDMPKGIVVGEDGLNDIYKAKTVKMCDYLFEKGHLPANHRDIMLSMRALAFKEASVNKLLNIDKKPLDGQESLMYNECSEFVEDDKEE